VEALGTDDPDLDVEVLVLAWSVCSALGLTRVTLLLNSLGDDACRPAYLEGLRSYLAEQRLCDEHAESYASNPLRVLDCKREICRAATEEAPGLVDNLCDPCAAHFSRVRAGLESLGVRYVMQPRLVRGLDYYTRTTFELAADSLESAQNAVGGGGRYDKLAEALGGPATPGIGFGLGIERLLLACDAEDVFPTPGSTVDVWVVDTTGGTAALAVTHELRAAGISADRSFDGRSMKSQFKSADRSGARVAVVVGEREVESGLVTVRDLEHGDERRVSRQDLLQHVWKFLS
jgi:histidyl-tRNA synthetase